MFLRLKHDKHDFNLFFVEKASKIHSSIAASTTSPLKTISLSSNSHSQRITELSEFRLSITEEIADIIKKMKIKTSPADPIPASV